MQLVYFAWVRERIGAASEALDPPPEVKTAADLAGWLCQRGDNYQRALGDRAKIRVAVNQTFVSWDHAVSTGDEVAFFPPVTGG